MHAYPHRYTATASGSPAGTVRLTSRDLPAIESAPPPEFDGPEGMWSPETLLCASLADCFVLSFRAVARASRLDWTRLACRVEGNLDRAEGVAQFIGFTTFATLEVPAEADMGKAHKALEKAEQVCLISNSLRGKRELVVEVVSTAAV